MKKKLWCLILVALAMSLPAQGSEKKTVAVVEFDVRGQLNLKDAGKIVAEWLSASLLKTGRYELTERVLLGKVLAEQKLAVSGMIDEATAVAIGQIAGARILATGSITEWNGLISLTARFIDAETGQIISSADYKTKDSGSIPLKMDKVAQVLAGILPPTAFEEENRLSGIGVKPGLWPVSIFFFLLAAAFTFFFRDPKRTPPEGEHRILSPADGLVVKIDTLPAHEDLPGPVTRICIFLSIFNVHLTRAPQSGNAGRVDYHPGRFFPAYRDEASDLNESNSILIRGERLDIFMKQIVGVAARRIKCFVRAGDRVSRGDLIGLMYFGSRVEVTVPPGVAVRAGVGDKVRAGESVIAEVNP